MRTLVGAESVKVKNASSPLGLALHVLSGSVPEVFAATGRWSEVRDHDDLTGRARFTTARLAR